MPDEPRQIITTSKAKLNGHGVVLTPQGLVRQQEIVQELQHPEPVTKKESD
jgi:hypothetical protein